MLLFSKEILNWSKVTVKTFIVLQKISVLNKCYFIELYYLIIPGIYIHMYSIEREREREREIGREIVYSTTILNCDNNKYFEL